MKFLLVYTTLFFSSWATAGELTGFCFGGEVNLKTVRQEMDTFLLPKDKVFERPSKNCIEVSISETRKRFFEKFLSKKFNLESVYQEGNPGASWNHSSEYLKKKCHLVVEKETVSNSTTSSLGIRNQRNANRVDTTQTKNTVSSSLILMNGLPGKLRTDQDSLDVVCQVLNSGRMRLTLSLVGETGGISTTLDVVKGQRHSIGDIAQNLKEKSKSFDLRGTAAVRKKSGLINTKYFLVIK